MQQERRRLTLGRSTPFSAFNQSSHGGGGNAPSPPPQRKRSHSSNPGPKVDNNNDENDEEGTKGDDCEKGRCEQDGEYDGCGGGGGK